MSWQNYVDTNLIGTGHVSEAAIYGLESKSEWAKSSGFKMEPVEIENIINAYTDPSAIHKNGIFLNKTKYFTLQVKDRSIYGKKESTGVCIVKTIQAVLICTYDDKIQPGNCTKVVEGLADYLIGQGY